MSPSAGTTTSTGSSTRWCPTAEQLMILEEMYRRGITTPKASQIQHITSYLSLYGKIEGKNVFYWFQNHKARDRQKLRRQLLIASRQQQQQQQQQQQLHHLHYHQYCCTHSTTTLHNSVTYLPDQASAQSNNINGGIMKKMDCHMMGSDYSSCCINIKPLRTLELFPTKSTTTTTTTTTVQDDERSTKADQR